MKRLNKVFLILALVTFSACNEQTEVASDEFKFVEVSIPDAYKSSTSGRISSEEVDDVILDVQITTTDGKEIGGKVHLIMPDDESLSYFAIYRELA